MHACAPWLAGQLVTLGPRTSAVTQARCQQTPSLSRPSNDVPAASSTPATPAQLTPGALCQTQPACPARLPRPPARMRLPQQNRSLLARSSQRGEAAELLPTRFVSTSGDAPRLQLAVHVLPAPVAALCMPVRHTAAAGWRTTLPAAGVQLLQPAVLDARKPKAPCTLAAPGTIATGAPPAHGRRLPQPRAAAAVPHCCQQLRQLPIRRLHAARAPPTAHTVGPRRLNLGNVVEVEEPAQAAAECSRGVAGIRGQASRAVVALASLLWRCCAAPLGKCWQRNRVPYATKAYA